MTPFRRKALEMLRDFGPLTPSAFAHKMWPDSPAWKHSLACGPNGAHRGRGMYKAGGSYIGKLSQAGLVEPDVTLIGNRLYHKGYKLSRLGEEELKRLPVEP